MPDQIRSDNYQLGRSSKVVVITTGGTIGSIFDPAIGKDIGLAGEDAVRAIVLGRGAEALPLWRRSSVDFGLDQALELADHIEKAVEECSADGVVVTLGTDTLEESAFVLEMVWPGEVPCVVTGSMLTPDAPGSDAEKNVGDAIRVAGRREHRLLGVMAVLGGYVHSARYVYKGEPTGTQAFRSYGPGPIGSVRDSELRPSPQYVSTDLHLPKPAHLNTPFVPLITMVGGDDGRILRSVGSLRPAGVVICGTGAGNVSSAALAEVSRLRARGVPVVLASRTGKPAVVPEIEGSPSRFALREIGCVFAASLNGVKARLLLMMLIANGLDKELTRWFETPA